MGEGGRLGPVEMKEPRGKRRRADRQWTDRQRCPGMAGEAEWLEAGSGGMNGPADTLYWMPDKGADK